MNTLAQSENAFNIKSKICKNNRSGHRFPLQSLQPSADKEGLVASPKLTELLKEGKNDQLLKSNVKSRIPRTRSQAKALSENKENSKTKNTLLPTDDTSKGQRNTEYVSDSTSREPATKSKSGKVQKKARKPLKKNTKKENSLSQSTIDLFLANQDSLTSEKQFDRGVLEKIITEGGKSDAASESGSLSSREYSALCRSIITESDLTAEKPSENYWKVIAEQRRIALAEALLQNQDYVEQMEVLEKHIEDLKEELDSCKNIVQLVHDTLQD